MRNEKALRARWALLTLMLAVCVFAPPISSVHAWQRTFGGSENDYGFFGQQTTDGGYIITGDTYSYGAGDSDAYLIKTDAYGNKNWENAFGGTKKDEGNAVRQSTDGGYVIAGSTASFGAGAKDVYLIKTNANGNKLWQKTFGGKNNDWGNSIQQTSDGGYILVGGTNSYGAGKADVYLIKTDANGKKLWQKTFGGTGNDVGNSVKQSKDGGYILVGRTESYGAGDFDVYLVKTDAKGNKLWQKTFGGVRYDEGYCVSLTTDGGYIIAGKTQSYGAGQSDVYLIKTDANGNRLWQKTYGGDSSDWGYSVQQTTDGGYVIAGSTSSHGSGHYDVYLIKTDAKGSSLWQKSFGNSGYEYGRYVQQTTDGGYIIVGYGDSGSGHYEVYLIKTDSKGNSMTKEDPD